MGQDASPTEAFIRLQNVRFRARPVSHIIHASTERRNHSIRSRVTVTAFTESEARRSALRTAYANAATMALVPRADFRQLSSRLAAVTGELRGVKATLLHEQKTSEGIKVDLEIVRPEAQLVADMRSEALSDYRMVALLPETIDGERVTLPTVETNLVGRLVDGGYTVYDENAVSFARTVPDSLQTSLASTEAANQMGTRCLANTVIVGRVQATFSQENNGIVSYNADANFRVIKVDTNQVIMADEYTEKGFGLNRRQAAQNALNALATTMADRVPTRLREHLAKHIITIVSATRGLDELAQMKQHLARLRGVRQVEQVPSAQGAEFHLLSDEHPAVLAAAISADPDYYVVDIHGLGESK